MNDFQSENPCSGVRPSLSSTTLKHLRTAHPIKAKFYVEPPWVGGTKLCSRHLGHMTGWPPRAYMVKPLQKSSFRNQWTDFHETWYVASDTLWSLRCGT